jgi:hypothetical protein
MSDSKRVNEKTRVALNLLAVHAIAAAQAVNASPQRIDAAKLARTLDEIEGRVRETRQEINR